MIDSIFQSQAKFAFAVVLLYAVAAVYFAAIAVWFWHLLTPARLHFLADNASGVLDLFLLFSILIGWFALLAKKARKRKRAQGVCP